MKRANAVARAWAILGAGLFYFHGAQAADLNCRNPVNNNEMGICSATEYKKATGELAIATAKVRRLLRGSRKALTAFKFDERDWSEFLDVRCSDGFLGFDKSEGGSGVTQAIARGYCKADEMRKRVKRLDVFH